MFNRSIFAVSALALSASVFAVAPVNPLDPQYKTPAFSDIHPGEGAMTRDE